MIILWRLCQKYHILVKKKDFFSCKFIGSPIGNVVTIVFGVEFGENCSNYIVENGTGLFVVIFCKLFCVTESRTYGVSRWNWRFGIFNIYSIFRIMWRICNNGILTFKINVYAVGILLALLYCLRLKNKSVT